jgi:hypothetical protein
MFELSQEYCQLEAINGNLTHPKSAHESFLLEFIEQIENGRASVIFADGEIFVACKNISVASQIWHACKPLRERFVITYRCHERIMQYTLHENTINHWFL